MAHQAIAPWPLSQLPKASREGRGCADLVRRALGHVGPERDVRGSVASGHIEPEPVADRDGLNRDQQPGGVLVVEAYAVAVEALHAAVRPAPLKPRRARSRRLPSLGKQIRHRLAVADKRLREGLSAGRRLGASIDDGHRSDELAGGVGLEPDVARVQVGPPGLVSPQKDAGVDPDGVEPGRELGADIVRHLPVGSDADDADTGAGLGVAGEAVADRSPDQLAVARCRRQVDSGDGGGRSASARTRWTLGA
jgi:hypothetical protein